MRSIKRILDEEKVKGLKDNAMLKHRPELFYEWDFQKNVELDVYAVTKASGKRAWWICSKCGSSYDMTIANRTKGHGCGYCSGRRVNHTNSLAALRPEIAASWDDEKNELTPHEVTVSSGKKVWWICERQHSYNSSVSNRTEGKGCPYCSGRKACEEFNLSVQNPMLAKQWHPTKNGVLTPRDVKSKSGKKAWWLGECGHEWETVIADRAHENQGCPYCLGRKVNADNCLATTNPKLAEEWHPTKNGDLTPKDVTSGGSRRKIWWIGKECGHEWDSSIYNRSQGKGCPYCSYPARKVLVGFNDIHTTHPSLGKLLFNQEDGYRYTQSSNTKVDWKCPECGEIIKKRAISQIHSQGGLSCPKCSDGISYPEKVMYNFLRAVEIDFEWDVPRKWSGEKRYDFYLPKYNWIIEVHGKQHYESGFGGFKGARTLEEERENDKFKKKLAKENGIAEYIVIDARESSIGFIRKNIEKSLLMSLLDIDKIDWEELGRISSKSVLFNICETWNDNQSIKNTAFETKLSEATVVKYLKQGYALGLCDYQPKQANRKG